MPQRIVLIRHGRSAHVHSGLLSAAEFLRWRDAYEAAGIMDGEAPPALASESVVVASDAPRAAQSARMLAPGKEVLVSPLLRELALTPPQLRWMRMPWICWAILIGIRWRATMTAEEAARAAAAADWLEQLARTHGSVAAVTHGSIRGLIARELLGRGWRYDAARRRHHHWSAWPISKA